jgi:hypothetical protein
MNRIATDITRAITPPSLFGIDRRIAYANRKYHSGWMCTGVTKGFAGVKLSVLQNTICGSTQSCSPEDGHNDARNMLR